MSSVFLTALLPQQLSGRVSPRNMVKYRQHPGEAEGLSASQRQPDIFQKPPKNPLVWPCWAGNALHCVSCSAHLFWWSSAADPTLPWSPAAVVHSFQPPSQSLSLINICFSVTRQRAVPTLAASSAAPSPKMSWVRAELFGAGLNADWTLCHCTQSPRS